jgi:hypothetical protein
MVEVPDGDKRPNDLQDTIIYGTIKFYSTGPKRQCYKPEGDKRPNVLQDLINYDNKKFYSTGPKRQCYKLFFSLSNDKSKKQNVCT